MFQVVYLVEFTCTTNPKQLMLKQLARNLHVMRRP